MLLFLPVIVALCFALLQLAVYALLKSAGLVREIPWFGLLLFRALIIVLALVAVTAVVLHYTDWGTGFDSFAL